MRVKLVFCVLRLVVIIIFVLLSMQKYREALRIISNELRRMCSWDSGVRFVLISDLKEREKFLFSSAIGVFSPIMDGMDVKLECECKSNVFIALFLVIVILFGCFHHVIKQEIKKSLLQSFCLFINNRKLK